MYKLVLDTATDYYYLALIKDNIVLDEKYEYSLGNHSETMMPALEAILLKNKLKLKDVKEIYTGVGPGSYTGERIAVVVSKMLGIMNNIPVYSFSTLALIASSSNSECYPFIDARRGNAYIAHFKNDETHLERIEEDRVASLDEYFLNREEDKKMMIFFGKPNAIKLINSKECHLVNDINALTPNYLQLVEAERKRRGLE